MKLTADQYYYVYFCMLEEPAMFKPLSYSSEFFSIRQPYLFCTDNASLQEKTYEQAVQMYLCQWLTQQKMKNLFPVDENSIEQYFAAQIVLGC